MENPEQIRLLLSDGPPVLLADPGRRGAFLPLNDESSRIATEHAERRRADEAALSISMTVSRPIAKWLISCSASRVYAEPVKGYSWRAAALSSLWKRVDGFAQLPEDWAGEGTSPVSDRTLRNARALLRALPDQLPLPQAAPSSDGEISFTWFQGPGRFDAAIQADGHLIWIFKKDGEFRPGGEAQMDGALPDGFLASLVDFFA